MVHLLQPSEPTALACTSRLCPLFRMYLVVMYILLFPCVCNADSAALAHSSTFDSSTKMAAIWVRHLRLYKCINHNVIFADTVWWHLTDVQWHMKWHPSPVMWSPIMHKHGNTHATYYIWIISSDVWAPSMTWLLLWIYTLLSRVPPINSFWSNEFIQNYNMGFLFVCLIVQCSAFFSYYYKYCKIL